MRRAKNKGSPPKAKTPAKDGAKAGARGLDFDRGQANKYTLTAPRAITFRRVWTVDANLIVVAFAAADWVST